LRARAATTSGIAPQPIRTTRAGNVDILLISPTGTLRQGRNAFTIEFRSVADGSLIDAGTVHASATMTMPGMVMPSNLQVTRSQTPGRYEATAQFGMAGSWPFAIEWDGPAGRGSATFEGTVQ
jgi:hypothetical protein